MTVGIVLLTLTAMYGVQVASVVRHTHQLLAVALPATAPDGEVHVDLRTVAIYDFLFTSQACGLAHLWLLWVAVLHLARHPERRVGLVRSLAVVLFVLLVIVWAMAIWLDGHGTSV